jgi:hypothetical protein
MNPPTTHSDFIVFADESGDHGLASIDPTYPIFALSFCLFRKEAYAQTVVPALTAFKLRWFGHDRVALHSHDIRKSRPPFDFLLDARKRPRFMGELSDLIESTPMQVVSAVIDKRRLVDRYDVPRNPYELAVRFCMERCYYAIRDAGHRSRLTHFVFESRGTKEDRNLELEFRRICDGANYVNERLKFEAVFAAKSSISSGLELADLVGHPIGRHVLDPRQSNRAFDVVRSKLRADYRGNFDGYGLKCFP